MEEDLESLAVWQERAVIGFEANGLAHCRHKQTQRKTKASQKAARCEETEARNYF